jgi:cytochrome c biogenesis protein CcmG, thiol:disulfide interchange protein DsbE
VSSRLPVLLGLITGVFAAVAVLAGAALLVPDAAAPSYAPPSLPVQTASPSVAASASVTPSGGASPSAVPSASAGASPSGGSIAYFHVGEAAPALVGSQVGGGTIDLATLKGKPVWVNFMATWCPPCRDEFPLMNSFANRYASKGLVVIAVDVKEDEGTAAGFAQSLNTTFPIGLDTDGTAQQRWGAVALPVHYWIDARGIVRDGSLGDIGPDIMAKGLESILPGVDVTP